MLALLLLSVVLLLLLNAFFALSEFAVVKIRPSWVEELEGRKHPKAPLVRHLHDHLDEYLSVVQVGITLTSIAMGFVGEPAVADLLTPLFVWSGAMSPVLAHATALVFGYAIISFLHIVLGELVPKGIAVRTAPETALRVARPMRFFYRIFRLPRWVLHRAAQLVLRALGMGAPAIYEQLSEDEIRALLGHSQERGLMSLRRLLMLENVLDLGGLQARDAMRPRDEVVSVRLGARLDEFVRIVRERHFARYPVVDEHENVVGTVHIKDAFAHLEPAASVEIARLVRPRLDFREDTPLEHVLAEFQRRREQMAIVTSADGRWRGILTLEDILEEIVGTLGDEFEAQKPVFLADLLEPERIVLDLGSQTLADALRELLARVPLPEALRPTLEETLLRREAILKTYVGRSIAIPHARLAGLERPLLLFARSSSGLRLDLPDPRAHLIFVVLTPSGAPGEHVRIVGRIAALAESEYVLRRLREVKSPKAVLDILREGDPSVNPE